MTSACSGGRGFLKTSNFYIDALINLWTGGGVGSNVGNYLWLAYIYYLFNLFIWK